MPLVPARLLLEDVGKTFTSRGRSPVVALRGVDLDVQPGDVVTIVGASGCGKSTLLRIVAGLERGDRGRVLLGDRVVTGAGPDRGMVFQEHRLLPWLTVADNIGFGLAGVSRGERARVVEHHAAMVGLAGFEGAYPHELSGGMAQRAALARALAPSPHVLLIDEPFAAVDALTKVTLQEELLRLRSRWAPTLLLVTHDIEEAVYLADRVVVMSDRPGTVERIVVIEPRHPRDRTSAEFSRARRAVESALAARSRHVTGAALERPAPLRLRRTP
jgi:sulfonate transport system ATP-binding protein